MFHEKHNSLRQNRLLFHVKHNFFCQIRQCFTWNKCFYVFLPIFAPKESKMNLFYGFIISFNVDFAFQGLYQRVLQLLSQRTECKYLFCKSQYSCVVSEIFLINLLNKNPIKAIISIQLRVKTAIYPIFPAVVHHIFYFALFCDLHSFLPFFCLFCVL